jgi:hypothetical protein
MPGSDRELQHVDLLTLTPVRTASWKEVGARAGAEAGSKAGSKAGPGERSDDATGAGPETSPAAAGEPGAAGSSAAGAAAGAVRVVVERPRPAGRGLRGLGERLSFLTGVKQVRLDEIGTYVWRRLDGAHTVGEICRQMRDELGERAEPVEERLRLFLGMLRRENLVGYPGWDDERIAGSPDGLHPHPPGSPGPSEPA